MVPTPRRLHCKTLRRVRVTRVHWLESTWYLAWITKSERVEKSQSTVVVGIYSLYDLGQDVGKVHGNALSFCFLPTYHATSTNPLSFTLLDWYRMYGPINHHIAIIHRKTE